MIMNNICTLIIQILMILLLAKKAVRQIIQKQMIKISIKLMIKQQKRELAKLKALNKRALTLNTLLKIK